MKQEIINELVKELFNTVDELHQEYSDNEMSYVIDTKKEDNKLTIEITLNKDKNNFEKYLDQFDDELFTEVLKELTDEMPDFAHVYNSDNYQKVIDVFKDKARDVIQSKIEKLQSLI